MSEHRFGVRMHFPKSDLVLELPPCRELDEIVWCWQKEEGKPHNVLPCGWSEDGFCGYEFFEPGKDHVPADTFVRRREHLRRAKPALLSFPKVQP